MKRAWLIVSAVCLLHSTVGRTEPTLERSPLDLAVHFGASFGPIQQPAGESKGNFGGYPVEVAIFFNTSLRTTLEINLGVIADVNNFQVSRVGFGFQFDYHLLGGSRRVETDYGNSLVIVRNPYNFSFIARQAFHHYNIVPPDPNLDPFGGSVLQTNIGAQLRYDITESLALSLDVLVPIYVIAMSSEKLKPSITEFVGALRFFL